MLRFILLLILFSVFASNGWSFTVIFKDGNRIEGTLMVENEKIVQIKDQSGVVRIFNKSELDRRAMVVARMTIRESANAGDGSLSSLALLNDEVRILGDRLLNYTYTELDTPPRLVIDFSFVRLNANLKRKNPIQNLLYSGVRLSPVESLTSTVRVVIDMKQPLSYELISEKNELRIRLQPKSDEIRIAQMDVTPALLEPASQVKRSQSRIPDTAAPLAPQKLNPSNLNPPPGVYSRRFSLEAGFSSIYESNLHHDEENIVESVGVVPSLNARFRNRVEDPNVLLRYEVGYHEYSNSTEWDRVSHNFRAGYFVFLGKKFLLENNGEIALNGSSEDRERGDQYGFRPVLNYNISHSLQLSLIGAYRYRKFENDTTANNKYAGLALTKEFDDHEVFLYYRYEYNNSENPRNDRTVITYFAGYTLPFYGDTTVSLGGRLRESRYTSRTFDIEVEDGPDIEILRRDKKWNFEIEFAIPLAGNLELVSEYEYEYRTSNDPEKPYDAHTGSISFVYSIW